MEYKETAVFAPSPTKTLQWSATEGGAQPASPVWLQVVRQGGTTNVIKAGWLVMCVLLFVCTCTNRVCWLSLYVTTSFLLNLVHVSLCCLSVCLSVQFLYFTSKQTDTISIFAVYIFRLPVFCFLACEFC